MSSSLITFVGFFAFVVGVTAAVHLYLARRLVLDLAPPPKLRRLGLMTVAALALMMPLSLAVARLLPRSLHSPLAWFVFTWMGLMFLLFVGLLLIDAGKLTALAVRVLTRTAKAKKARIEKGMELSSAEDVDPSRRYFLARLGGGTAAASAFGFGGAGMVSALGSVSVKEVDVPIAELPATFDGFRIVQLSDIHIGPTLGKSFSEHITAVSNAQNPDLVAITGDLVDGSVQELGPLVAPLGRLRAKHGTYFVTGNHEYYSGADDWIAFVRSLGIRVLRNEHVLVEHRGESIALAGVDDWTADKFGGDHGADLSKALKGLQTLPGTSRPELPVVLLAHQPKAVVEASSRGVALHLAGHTHGGQIFPFNFLVKLQQPYVAGLHNHDGTQRYGNSGTGFWGPPMRLGTESEITLIRLRRAP